MDAGARESLFMSEEVERSKQREKKTESSLCSVEDMRAAGVFPRLDGC